MATTLTTRTTFFERKRTMNMITKLYRIVGWLLMRRKYYQSVCSSCGTEVGQYFPKDGAFFWERKYWQWFQSGKCRVCEEKLTGALSSDGLWGAMLRLPGYARHERKVHASWSKKMNVEVQKMLRQAAARRGEEARQ